MSTLTQPITPRLSGRDLARYIDHTLLKPEATEAQIVQLCEEAQRFHFMAVCVNPIWVKRCAVVVERHRYVCRERWPAFRWARPCPK